MAIDPGCDLSTDGAAFTDLRSTVELTGADAGALDAGLVHSSADRTSVGATKALSNALLGVGNALDETSRRKIEDVSFLPKPPCCLWISANVGRNISRIRRGCSAREGWKGEGMCVLDWVSRALFAFWVCNVCLWLGFVCIAMVLHRVLASSSSLLYYLAFPT